MRLLLRRIKPNWRRQRAAPTMQQQPVSFPDWKDAIAREPLSAALRAAYIREIITFLKPSPWDGHYFGGGP